MTALLMLSRGGRRATGAPALRTSVSRLSSFPPAGSLPLAADCFISRLHLHDFVDGELDADVPGSALREVILGHLSLCPRCTRLERQVRAFRVRLRALGSRLEVAPDERASPEFRARMERLLAG